MDPTTVERPNARLDKLAERAVEDLCFELDGTCHRVGDDQHGWDLMVEFPARRVEGLPDQQPAIRRCLIQVKSTRTGDARTAVKLSNAVKFAKDPLPCFIALVSYDKGSSKPAAIYLRHFWTPLIAQALSAARVAGLAGKKLNRVMMPIKFERSDRHDERAAEAIVAEIDEVGARYPEQKTKIWESVGYEDAWGQATFELGPTAGPSDFKDLLLGLRDSIAIENLTFVDKRFGLPGTPVLKGAATLSITHERPRCVVSLERRKCGEEISWPGHIYSDYMMGADPGERRVRAAAGPIQVIMRSPGTTTVTWKQALDERMPLEDLRRSAEARSWMASDEQIQVSIWSDGRRVTVDRMEFEKQKEIETWRELAASLRALCSIAPPERRPPDLLMSLEDILRRLDSLTQFSNWLGPKPCSVRVTRESDWTPDLDNTTHLILPWMTRVGDFVFVAIFERRVLETTRSGPNLDFSTADGQLLRGAILPANGDAQAVARAEIDWARHRSAAPGKVLLSYEPDGDSGTIVLTRDDDPPIATPAVGGPG